MFFIVSSDIFCPGPAILYIARIKEFNSCPLGSEENLTPEKSPFLSKIAIENKNVNVEVIDVFTFPDFKEKYDIMSVPAMIINDKDIFFGQKNIDEVIETLM